MHLHESTILLVVLSLRVTKVETEESQHALRNTVSAFRQINYAHNFENELDVKIVRKIIKILNLIILTAAIAQPVLVPQTAF